MPKTASLCLSPWKSPASPCPQELRPLGQGPPWGSPLLDGTPQQGAGCRGWRGGGLCLRAGGGLLGLCSASPRLLEKGSWITREERPGDGGGTQNITVNTTLSSKHPRAAPATRRKVPPANPLCSVLPNAPEEKYSSPLGRQKNPLPEVLTQGVGGNRPFVTAGPRHAMLPPRRGGDDTRRSGRRSTEENPADSGRARKAGLMLCSLLFPPLVSNVSPRERG